MPEVRRLFGNDDDLLVGQRSRCVEGVPETRATVPPSEEPEHHEDEEHTFDPAQQAPRRTRSAPGRFGALIGVASGAPHSVRRG